MEQGVGDQEGQGWGRSGLGKGGKVGLSEKGHMSKELKAGRKSEKIRLGSDLWDQRSQSFGYPRRQT